MFKRVAAMIAATAAAAVQAAPVTPPIGLWQNPRNSVRIRAEECGSRLCGYVVWASAKAIEDARAGGTPRLIGTALLQDYRNTGQDSWQGRVFVPDMGDSFFSRLHRIDADHLKISGCILGGLICKSQIWTRAG